jgi:hypothetical protein
MMHYLIYVFLSDYSKYSGKISSERLSSEGLNMSLFRIPAIFVPLGLQIAAQI